MNDAAASWEALLRVDLMAAAFGVAALWIHAKWRKRVAADRWRWRRRVAGISLIAFDVSLLAFVGMSRLNDLCTFASFDMAYFEQMDRLIHRLVSVSAIVESVSGTLLIGVMSAPVAGETEA